MSFRNPFPAITSLSEFYFRFRRFILLVQIRKAIPVNYGSNTSSWKPRGWVRLDLILMIGDIYINLNLNPLTKFTSSSRSTKSKDILTWKIFQTIMKTIPINMRIVISYAIKSGITNWIWQIINGTERTTWLGSFNIKNSIIKQMLLSEEINPKEQGCESHNQLSQKES